MKTGIWLQFLSLQYQNIRSIYILMIKSEEIDQFSIKEKNKGKYSKTTMKKKTQLIQLVIEQKLSIYKASKKLRMSNSTSKSIIKNYIKYGTILQRNTKNRIQNLKSTFPEQEESSQLENLEDNSKEPIVKEEAQKNEEQESIKKQEPYPVEPIFIVSYPFGAFGYAVPYLNKM